MAIHAPAAAWPAVSHTAWIAGAAAVAVAFAGAVALPLATYTTVLALFGFAHVASELRYVDCRFGARLGGRLPGQLGIVLGFAVVVRLAGMQGWLPASLATGLEVLSGAALIGLVCLRMRRHCWLAVAVASVLAAGAIGAPFETLLLLAVAHNLTPLAFLAEALRGRRRRVALTVAGLGFVVLPLLIASGLPYAGLAALGLVDPEATLFQAGSLTRNLGAYVPASMLYSDWALHAFAASVFAQCMHYIAVIGVLPRLVEGAARPILPWPDAVRFRRWLTVGAAALALGFVLDYGLQRQVYALAALVHAWLELPVLALAVGSAQARPSA
jgi:hypothetical protein